MDCREFFNSVAEKWDGMCMHDAKKINKILDMTDLREGQKVLDVGTGTGVMIPFLLARVGACGGITAVDVAENMLEIARSKNPAPNVSFIQADVTTADLGEDSFDLIVCYSVFPHFKDQPMAIGNMHRFLKSGGKILVCHSQSREDINKLHSGSSSEEINRDYLPSAAVIGEYMRRRGMKVLTEIESREMFVVMAQKF